MKVKYRDIKNNDLLFTCDMNVIPRKGEKIVIKQGVMTIKQVWWWIDSPSDKYVNIYLE